MSNPWFRFKQFQIHQDRCAMKVTTDACLFGAWVAERVGSWESGVGIQESGVGSREPIASKVLDIGAGTGLLSLMLAQKMNGLIDAIEVQKDAFEQAKENIADSAWADKIKIFHVDARQLALPYKYDIIISNPPFYENELKSPDSRKNIAQHDGLTLNELLKSIQKNLSPGGKFYLLLPYKRITEIEKQALQNGLSVFQKTLVRQSVNHDYFRFMIAGEHLKEKEKIIDEISIRNDKDQYTDRFIALLKDFYLAL